MGQPAGCARFCSLGVSVDVTARRPCREDPDRPGEFLHATHAGHSFLHVRDIDWLVEHHEPLLEWPVITHPTRYPADCRLVASLISDGDTLQMGIGHLPDAILSSLCDRKDLGSHEMLSDGVLPLVAQGVITGQRKTLHQGRS